MPDSDRRLHRPGVKPGEPIWLDRGYHPHFESQSHVQHVCVHLADSLPKVVVDQMARALHETPPAMRDAEKVRRVNDYLDAGHGDCVLREREVALLVQESLHHFANTRYTLHAWCIMPNHVHILMQPLNGITMSTSMASWKKFTGRRISEWRQRHRSKPPGPAWHREYYDRYIRDEAHFRNVVAYIHQNPVKAGLVSEATQWEWSSAFRQG
jgi:REP element-mobilizing transposase RayT